MLLLLAQEFILFSAESMVRRLWGNPDFVAAKASPRARQAEPGSPWASEAYEHLKTATNGAAGDERHSVLLKTGGDGVQVVKKGNKSVFFLVLRCDTAGAAAMGRHGAGQAISSRKGILVAPPPVLQPPSNTCVQSGGLCVAVTCSDCCAWDLMQ